MLVAISLGAEATAQRRTPGYETAYRETHAAMGTIFTLYIYSANERQADALAQEAFDEVDRVEQLLSNYRPSSELSRINANAAAGPVVTDPETFEFLRTSLEWSARTDGAFDITVGRLMKAWGFFRAQGHVPDAAELAQTGKEIGWRKVQLNTRSRTVRFTAPGLELDPGGIGKGYVVDRMVARLRAQHVSAALISAGSSTIYGIGAPPGSNGWKVQVPDPNDKLRPLSTVTLRDTSLSTSGCTQKYFILGAHRYCHIMDPHTLRPVEGMRQTTVIDPSATDSDALSASLFVLGPAGSERLLRTVPQASALLVSADGNAERCVTIRWAARISSRSDTLPCENKYDDHPDRTRH